jgi:hypothetical protein
MINHKRLIYEIAEIVYHAWKIGPENEPFILPKSALKNYTDADSILAKLERQYGVLEVKRGLTASNEGYTLLVNEKMEIFFQELQHEQFEAIAIMYSDIPLQPGIHNATETKPVKKLPEIDTKDVKLKPSSYKSRIGILELLPNCKVEIAVKGKVMRSKGLRYEQCRVLDVLFKDVNRLSYGVHFSQIIGVNDTLIDAKKIKSIRNSVDEINRKVKDKSGIKRLIFIQGRKVHLDKSYL